MGIVVPDYSRLVRELDEKKIVEEWEQYSPDREICRHCPHNMKQHSFIFEGIDISKSQYILDKINANCQQCAYEKSTHQVICYVFVVEKPEIMTRTAIDTESLDR